MSGFAVGEEAEQPSTGVIREVGQDCRADRPRRREARAGLHGACRRGGADAQDRPLLPGGTVDSFDIWLELQAKDADGRVIFWSGQVEDDGKGPVEPGAHFYKSYQLDGDGNPINKRNAWQARSVLYVRLIPPGAADVAHYRVKIPKDAKGPITLDGEAELSQVLLVLHAVLLTPGSRSRGRIRRS